MRRTRRTNIIVSEDFYNLLDNERKIYEERFKKKGYFKPLKMSDFTEILARRKRGFKL